MSLPQELIDEILSHLPFRNQKDQQTLQNCSLVAKSWIDPSRRRLFETIRITDWNCQSWMDKIPPSNTELLRHVRHFCLFGPDPQEPGPVSECADISNFCVYFPSLRRLHTIELCDAYIPNIPQRIEMFSPCQQVLSSLIFAGALLPWRSFIALIDYFPNLRNLELQSLHLMGTDRNSPPLSRPLRGTLRFCLSEEESLRALSNWFTGLEVGYEELEVGIGYVRGTYSQPVIEKCAKTLKRLKFQLCECIVPRTPLRMWLIQQPSGCPYEPPPLFGA